MKVQALHALAMLWQVKSACGKLLLLQSLFTPCNFLGGASMLWGLSF